MVEPGMLGRTLLLIGGLILLAGLIFILFGRLGIGRLPGDIFIERGNFRLYFPLATGLILSLLLTLILNLVLRR